MRRDGNRLLLDGPVTLDTVPGLLPEALAAVKAGVETLDFTDCTAVDSAAIAFALDLRRASDGRLALVNLPDAALKLARLYSVSDQLGLPD